METSGNADNTDRIYSVSYCHQYYSTTIRLRRALSTKEGIMTKVRAPWSKITSFLGAVEHTHRVPWSVPWSKQKQQQNHEKS